MTAGDAPNVIMPHLDAAQQFAQDGYFVNLTHYIQGPNGFTKSELNAYFYPSVWNGRAIEPGKQYVLPFEENGHMVIFYNASLFQKAGIQQPPRTWLQLAEDAQKITALGGNIHGIAWTPSMEQFFAMVADNDGKIWATSSETKFALDNPQAVATLAFLRNLVAKNEMIITQNYDYQLDFGTGDVGILIESSAGWTYDVQSAGGKFPVKASPGAGRIVRARVQLRRRRQPRHPEHRHQGAAGRGLDVHPLAVRSGLERRLDGARTPTTCPSAPPPTAISSRFTRRTPIRKPRSPVHRRGCPIRRRTRPSTTPPSTPCRTTC